LLRHLAADVVRGLRGSVELELLVPRLADDCAWLYRRADQTVVYEIDGDHADGGAERGEHGRFIAARPVEAHIAGRAGMQLGRGGFLRRARVGDGGERLVFHHDAVSRLECLGDALRNDCRDRFPDMAHLLARQCKARRLGHGRALARTDHPQRPHGCRPIRRHVRASEDGDDTRRSKRVRCLDPANGRVRVRRANEHAVERAREVEIGHEAPPAGQKPPIFDATQGEADTLVPADAPTHCAALLDLIAHEVEPLERRLVRHHEEIGVAAARLVARPRPVRDGEDVVL
jgi:hypothetical protein